MPPPKTILLLLWAEPEYARRAVYGVREFALERGGWRLVLGRPELRWLQSQALRVDGMIGFLADRSLARAAAASGVPSVNISAARADSPVPRVMPDQEEVGRLGARHLLDQGLRRLAYVGTGSHFSDLRGQAFAAEARAAGAAVQVWPNCDPDMAVARIRRGSLSAGVMAGHDYRALELVDGALRAGLRVPDDLAVVGADNTRLICELSPVSLTSVDTAGERVGRAAAELLARLMDGGRPPEGDVTVGGLRVVARASTDLILAPSLQVVRAVRFIRDHAGERLDVDRVAAEAGCSRRTLERHMRRDTGRSVHAEIRRVQFERAARLLVETDRKVLSVALDCGFSDLSPFLRQFRRIFGLTPTQYRRRHRAQGPS
jgi:LacI family transcriptional regulator